MPMIVGDRVTRQAFMDDGTWAKEGDPCLARSPLRRGQIIGWSAGTFRVRWDDGEVLHYFPHGIDPEPETS